MPDRVEADRSQMQGVFDGTSHLYRREGLQQTEHLYILAPPVASSAGLPAIAAGWRRTRATASRQAARLGPAPVSFVRAAPDSAAGRRSPPRVHSCVDGGR